MSDKVTQQDLQLIANTIRGLAMDGVQAANSGHPGMPMGMADVAAVLFMNHLKYCPTDPQWPDRDRFVLSGGHGSMLLYSLLHLAGYDLPLDELKRFRQWGSRTPGHPEYHETPGVETTTGPLGQGCGNAVGMALAERMLAARFNTEALQPVDHYTYVFCGDGDLMEGVSHEAFSTAGHLRLNRLIVFYDSNDITIEGSTKLAYSDNVKRRFEGYNWGVLQIDGHDLEQIEKAIRKARRSPDRPTLIICRTHIAKGSPHLQDSHEAHGAPLGVEEVKLTKQALGLPPDETFYVPARVRACFEARAAALKRKYNAWKRHQKQYGIMHADLAAAWQAGQEGRLPENLDDMLPVFDPEKPLATRQASGKTLQCLAKAVPFLVGGAADLAPSTRTFMDSEASVGPASFAGRNLHFGVREHGMGAILNGLALHGGFRVYGSTFFVFTDYFRPTIRLAALMKLPVIYVLTHDSFYVGEDGPTHQPVEHLAALRVIPNLTCLRPADPTETAAAWAVALRNTQGPTALMLTRQNMAVIDRTRHAAAANVARGAYILSQTTAERGPDVILIGTGSEVELAMKAAKVLSAETNVRVVSMPSWELFEQQPAAYRDEVLPPGCPRRVAVEAGVTQGWERYVGPEGRVIGIDRFGASAPAKTLAEHFGFTVDNVVAVVRSLPAARAS